MVKTCEDSFKEMYQSFRPEAAGNLNVTYCFDISGSGGGKWTLSIKDGKCDLTPGVPDKPSVTIVISAQDWLSIHEGKLNSQMAFMMGKLRVTGDMSLAMKLQSMFPGSA